MCLKENIASRPDVLCKKGVLKNSSFRLREIFKNTYFVEHLQTVVSGKRLLPNLSVHVKPKMNLLKDSNTS